MDKNLLEDKQLLITKKKQRNNKMTDQSRQDRQDRYQDLYRKADPIRGMFGGTYFDIRFDQIRNSLVDANPFKVIWTMLRWRLGYTNRNIPRDLELLEQQLPMTKPEFQVQVSEIKYTWIGHSTAVISFGSDANFLIDPVFSDRCSPYQFIGPKRFRPPACLINELPRIDAVLVSHDHYDHLDEHSLSAIHKRFPIANFVAGLNSKDVFPTNCKMHEMDWTQTKQIQINNKVFKITFVPVCHWGRRGLFDKNKRLWGGFVVQAPTGQKIFYSGDTGYAKIFSEIGEVFQSFDLSILPIGAYQPRQFLRNQHVNPEQAVKIHKDINSKKSVGVHWGTFPLGFQHYTAAREDLKKAKITMGLKDEQFLAIGHGESFTIPYKKKEYMNEEYEMKKR